MKVWAACLLTASAGCPAADLILVVGEPGTPEYAQVLEDAAASWRAAAEAGDGRFLVIGLDEPAPAGIGTNDHDRLRGALARATNATEDLWVVLHGHGTYDGRRGRFNLRGLDVTDTELRDWLKPVAAADRRTAVLCCFAAGSVPFMRSLSASNRVVVSATRNPSEDSFSHFGRYLAEAVGDPEADVDHDEAVSLLEAFLSAGRRTEEFYLAEQRILTEHALIDDNGDQAGTPVGMFTGTRAKPSKTGALPDGLLANQTHLIPSAADRTMSAETRATRDRLERELHALRARKQELGEAYWTELKTLMLRLAELYGS